MKTKAPILSLFESIKQDRIEKRQRVQEGLREGRLIHEALNSWLDKADQEGQCLIEDDWHIDWAVASQALFELQEWIKRQNGLYQLDWVDPWSYNLIKLYHPNTKET